MKILFKMKALPIIMVMLGVLGCKSNALEQKYNPNEFTLMVAASNHGEVGPCG